MTLRLATATDLTAIMDLERRSFPTDAWSEDTMASELVSAHNHYLVDEEDGRVIGYGGLRALRGGTDADIQTIAFEAEFRGQGRGRALLRALTAEAVARGARELFLEVRADNPVAEGLYASEGFAELGRRPRYYQPDDVDAVVMRLDLREWAAASVGASVGASIQAPAAAQPHIPHAREENSRLGGEIPVEDPPNEENSSRARAAGATDAAQDGAV